MWGYDYIAYCNTDHVYNTSGRGFKTAYIHLAESQFDPLMYGRYEIPKVTTLIQKEDADWFMQNQANQIAKVRYNAREDETLKYNSTDVPVSDELRERYKNFSERKTALSTNIAKFRDSRKLPKVINELINEYETLRNICEILQLEVEGTPMERLVAQSAGHLYRIGHDLSDLRTKAIEQKENAGISGKKFADSNAGLGSRLKNLFNWN